MDNDADIGQNNNNDQDDNRDFDITDPNLDVVTEEELTQSGNTKGDFVCTLCPKKKLDSMLAVREHLQSKGHLKREQIAAKLVAEEEERMKAEKTKGKKKKADTPEQLDATTTSPSNTNKKTKNKKRQSGEQIQSEVTPASEQKKSPQSHKKERKSVEGTDKQSKGAQNTTKNTTKNTTPTKGQHNTKHTENTAEGKSDTLKRKRGQDSESGAEEQPQHKKPKRVEHSPASKKGKSDNGRPTFKPRFKKDTAKK
eukprot:TRINITY_DN4592_c0_g1_i1.p1 TRINITY_DN4592_c0_g1~~TRINITY_DN4592_c0_g1_i1.p1  ORF type:complete len:298 (-),score=86.90 TRINITY_DN4592_c0_g1_i1:31-792(-)